MGQGGGALLRSPVLDDPEVSASFGAVADQQHRVAQVVRVTVRLVVDSCEGKFDLLSFIGRPLGGREAKTTFMCSSQ